MFKLDDNFLTELGLASLPPAEKNKMLSHIYETLEMKVGMRLAEKMSNEQLDEFEGYINSNDEQGALKWLETNFPNYKQVVAEELEKLKVEIRQVAPQIISQAAQQPLPDPAQSNNQATGQAPVPQQPQQFAQPSPHGAPAMQQGQSLAGGGTPGPYAPQQQQPYPSSPQPAHPGTPSSTAAYGASQPAQFQQPGTGAPAPPTPAPRGAAHSSLYPDPQSNGTPAAPAPQPQSPFPHQQPDPQL